MRHVDYALSLHLLFTSLGQFALMALETGDDAAVAAPGILAESFGVVAAGLAGFRHMFAHLLQTRLAGLG
jgi:hypothetical protein